MAFLDDLAKKIGNVADKAVDKAKDLTEIGRLNLAISAEEKQLQSWYAEIGKVIYEEEKDQLDGRFLTQCVKIQSALEKLDSLNEQLIDVKENGYTEVIDVEATPADTAEETVILICSGCGKTMPTGSAFCSVCGTKMESF